MVDRYKGMKNLMICVLAMCCAVGAGAQGSAGEVAAEHSKIVVGPSETTELMSVIMYLSGAEEYTRPQIWPEYRELVDSVFGQHREHLAIQLIRDLRNPKEGYGMVWEKPMMLAVNIHIKNGRLRGKYYREEYGEYWSKKEHKKLLAAATDFYRDADFHTFYTEQAVPRYASASESMEKLYNSMLDIGWIAEFTGISESKSDLDITLSYLNFWSNYGMTDFETNRPRPVNSIHGPNTRELNYERAAMLLLHETMHHYFTPLNDKYADAVAASGEILFPPMREKVEPYDPWDAVTNEMIVRGPEIVYMLTHDIYKREIAQAIANQKDQGFWFIEEFVALLMNEYVTQRDKYPTLESFMPEIVKFYDDLAAKAPEPGTAEQ